MKNLKLLALVAAIAGSSAATAQVNVVAENLNGEGANLITNAAGVPIPDKGGYLWVGTFSISDDAILSALNSGDVASVLAAWTAHGTASTIRGVDIAGIFGQEFSSELLAGDFREGKSIYTWIASTADPLATDAEYLIFKHNVVFPSDPVIPPPTTVNVSLTPAGGTLIFGDFAKYSFDLGFGAGSQGAYSTLAAIPEPSTVVLLGLGALGAFFVIRRRR